MRVYHDSRNVEYRLPYGAVPVGEPVEMAIDVWDSPGAAAVLRTWTDGVGETLYGMVADEAAGDADDGHGEPTRYRVSFSPEAAGSVWYQFVITDLEGYEWRYGAQNGRMGGEGQLVGWEPPSFLLTAYDPDAYAPAWHQPIDALLHNPQASGGLAELVQTMAENYPAALCDTVLPWDGDGSGRLPRCAGDISTMEAACDAVATRGGSGPAWFSLDDDVFGFWRLGEGGMPLCVLMNASDCDAHVVAVPLVREDVTEVVGGYAVPVSPAGELDGIPEGTPRSDSYAMVHLYPFGSAMLHFCGRDRLAAKLDDGVGVLAHVTSLPGVDEGVPGTLGAPARAFVDWLAETGARYWQVLPVSPTDEYGSPYAGISAFAGNALLLEDVDAAALASERAEEYRAFCQREGYWLEPYSCFMAIRRRRGSSETWQQWPKKYLRFDSKAVERDAKLSAFAEECRQEQFAFECQWKELREYANKRGVKVIGDMPIYVSADSADVWAHPGLFQLDAAGNPEVVAGCPPDSFAVDGQVWGNPVYDWDAMAAEGYDWWLRRLKRAFDLYDYVRLDHFIGFSRYYCIPAGRKAAEGAYRPGPGYAFFSHACGELGPLPVIAEDLGLITPRVRALIDDCGFLGMDILQFVDGNDPLSGYRPRPGKIAYTGTHDNQTLVGYIRERYPHEDERPVAEKLLDAVATCDAPIRMFPLQDLIGLGDEARMNVPGVAEGNWMWRASHEELAGALEAARSVCSACR